MIDVNNYIGIVQLAPLILEQLPPNCKSLLDIGCGDGALTAELKAKADSVIGVDIDGYAIDRAKATLADRPGLEFRLGAVENLDEVVGNSVFDCVVSVLTLHHLDIPYILTLMRRHLAVGGRMIIVDLYAERTTSLIWFLADQFFFSHLHERTAVVQTVRHVGLLRVLRFLLWRIAFATSSEGRRHIRQDLSLKRPFPLSQWRCILKKALPNGIEQVLIGSVFMYVWNPY